ncbi:MAG: hypothetical protein K6F42_03605 [Bacteroidales bacterium]|nr:hypothetical protein [Bacteroidales bacterium]
MRRALLIFCLVLLSVTAARAQFMDYGNEPAYTRWHQIKTDHFRLVYPAGIDSLAREYARRLEFYRDPVAGTIGFAPNQSYRRPMPVILHPFYTRGNGMVVWAPRRMELYTTPDANAPEAMPWITMLAVHESRHVAQMQPYRLRYFSPFHYLFGEMFTGAMSAVYGGPAFFEGDAVHAETALNRGGRGHDADFLDYLRMAFDNGDLRNYYRWRYGSIKRYTPDYYRAGYLLVGGMEHAYGEPAFAKKYYQTLLAKGRFFPFGVMNKTARAVAGMPFKDAFRGITNDFRMTWTAEADARGPFMPSEPVSATPRKFTSYRGSFFADGRLISATSSMQYPRTLDGRPYAESASIPRYSAGLGKAVWSETLPNLRWEMNSKSDLFSYDPARKRKARLTRGERLFNPAPSAAGTQIAAIEYPVAGGSALVLLSPAGEKRQRIAAPGDLQLVECAWVGETVYVSAIGPQGIGIYELREGRFAERLAPTGAKIKELRGMRGALYFTADPEGVNELYRLGPAGAERMTRTRYGASDFVFNEAGDTLYYSALVPEGRLVRKTAVRDLQPQPAVFPAGGPAPSLPSEEDCAPAIGEPASYNRLAHLIRVHSWVPLHVEYDNVLAMSEDQLKQVASPGATAFFQNDLSTLSGVAAYSITRQGGYAKLTYSGLWAVLEGQFSSYKGSNTGSLYGYLPINLSSGGWRRGIVPQARYVWIKGQPGIYSFAARAYVTRAISDVGLFPRWGIGVEYGYAQTERRKSQYIYGYVPGLLPEHGLKLTNTTSKQDNAENPFSTLFTADYAMAILPVDWAGLSPVAYLRNFELILHGEYGLRNKVWIPGYGATLYAHLGNFLWIPYDTRIGCSIQKVGTKLSLSLMFSIDI